MLRDLAATVRKGFWIASNTLSEGRLKFLSARRRRERRAPPLPRWRAPCYTGRKSYARRTTMHLNGLPVDLAKFVDDALASGHYPSVEALVCDALQILREYDAPPSVLPSEDERP